MHLNFCYAFEMLRMHMHNYSRCFAVFRPLLVYVHECVEFFFSAILLLASILSILCFEKSWNHLSCNKKKNN